MQREIAEVEVLDKVTVLVGDGEDEVDFVHLPRNGELLLITLALRICR